MLSRAIAVPRRTGAALAALGFATLVVVAVLSVGAEGPESERSLAQRHWWKKRMAWKNRHDEFQSWFEEQRALQPSKIVSKAEAFNAWKVENAPAARPAKELSSRRKGPPTASKFMREGGLRSLVASACVDDDAAVDAKCKAHAGCDGVSTCAHVVMFHQCNGFFSECCEACTAQAEPSPSPLPAWVASAQARPSPSPTKDVLKKRLAWVL